MALLASDSLDISTKPKPRDRPVWRSVMTFAETTLPCASKADFKASSFTAHGRLPTKILVLTKVTSKKILKNNHPPARGRYGFYRSRKIVLLMKKTKFKQIIRNVCDVNQAYL